MALVLAGLVIAFLVIRVKQERDARLASEQIERAHAEPPGDNAAETAPGSKSKSGSNAERGAYGIPRKIIGPTGADAEAISALKAILRAQMAYMTETTAGYATFDQLVAHGYLRPAFAGEHPVISGYRFTLSIQGSFAKGSAPVFKVNADPVSGAGRHYYLSDNSPIRYSLSGPATEKDQFEEYQ